MCLAVPGQVVRTWSADGTRMAEVDFGGLRKDVCLEYVPAAAVDDYVLVHVGFAIQQLDEHSARQTLAGFERMGVLAEELGEGPEEPSRQGVPE
jgi:hydrogenase expression/formation protein HypC